MIVITGVVQAGEQTVDELLTLALEHVHRSRAEPGCLEHGVYRDLEDPLRLLFFERWADADAVRAHFAVPASGAYVRAAERLSVGAMALHVYDAGPVPLASLAG